MRGRRLYKFLYIFLYIIFFQSLITAQESVSKIEDTSTDLPETEINLIHSGDLIDVDVIGNYEYDWRGTLDEEGFLSGINFVENPVYALCRSEESVAEDLAKAYGKILRDPKVVVKILDRSNRPASVIYGAVKTPQRFQIKRPALLSELIVASGGLTDRASGEIQIFRPRNANCLPAKTEEPHPANSAENRERIVKTAQENDSQYVSIKIGDLLAGKKEANPQVLSGDIITVAEAQPIYVIGGVANPRQITARSEMTLTRAIDSAGGIAKGADSKKISVFRRVGAETKIIQTDLNKIKANPSADVVLQAFDVVEVEQSGREKRKFPPVLKTPEIGEKTAEKLPLRIID